MQTLGLVISTGFDRALFASLSMALYRALPQSVLECAARHGRFAGLGTRDRNDHTPSGNALVIGFDALQGQSV